MHLNDKEDDAVNFLTGYEKLQQMGFHPDSIQEALVISANHLGQAIDYLSKDS